MTDTAYFCTYCKARLSNTRALPYVLVQPCWNCERLFVVVAFEAAQERFHCCLALNEQLITSTDTAARVGYIMRLIEPYLSLMGDAAYREALEVELTHQTYMQRVVESDEFIEEGLYHPDQSAVSVTHDWRTEWVCECRYCGYEITSGWSVFPPTFHFKGDCPQCHKRLEVRVQYPNRGVPLPQALLPPARLIDRHNLPGGEPSISDQELRDFKRLLCRRDLGFPKI